MRGGGEVGSSHEEGDDIYHNCHISSFPRTFREAWFYPVRITLLHQIVTAGIEIEFK